MTDAEFRTFVSRARAEIDAELARLDAINPSTLSFDARALFKHRQNCMGCAMR
jgi:hypothetical protein